MEKSSSDDRHVLDLRRAAALARIERPGAEERDPRLRRPADVRIDGVLQRRPLADELAVLLRDVDKVPVQPCVESRGQPSGDVRAEHRVREQHGVDPLVAHELREHVDARLRQRRFQLRIVGDVDLRRAELAGAVRKPAHVRADHDARNVCVTE